MSIITSCVNNMILSLRGNIIIIQFWFCVTTVPTGRLIITVLIILLPWSQLTLANLIISSKFGNLSTFRREYVCVVEFWRLFLHMIFSFKDRIKILIYPILVGVPQSHKKHKWIADVVQHMELVEKCDDWWYPWHSDEDYYSPLSAIMQNHSQLP